MPLLNGGLSMFVKLQWILVNRVKNDQVSKLQKLKTKNILAKRGTNYKVKMFYINYCYTYVYKLK